MSRFVWHKTGNMGVIKDKITKKEYTKGKQLLILLNNIWEETKRFEKENQRLNEENQRLNKNKKELNMIVKSYKDYYGKDIQNAEWYGYVKRCYMLW